MIKIMGFRIEDLWTATGLLGLKVTVCLGFRILGLQGLRE